jgi:hypothetical protein
VIGSVNESNAEHYAALLDVHGFVVYFADPRLLTFMYLLR